LVPWLFSFALKCALNEGSRESGMNRCKQKKSVNYTKSNMEILMKDNGDNSPEISIHGTQFITAL